jgi:hypothetical protein
VAGALRRPPSLNAVVGAVVAFISLLIGLAPLNDNSFFTHLATGRLIWDTHHLPHSDPYTFTAAGHDWVVQSWLASVLYAGAERVWGAGGILVLVALAAMAVGVLTWLLTAATTSLFSRILIMLPVLIVGTDGGWVERPLLFGLICLCLLLLAAEGRLNPVWLVPTMWFWANTHGSFPLGLVAVGTLAVGRRLDNEDATVELQALKWAGIGTLAAVIGPLGFHILTFPVELLRRQDVLSNVIEWQAPKFTGIGQRAFLAEVVLAIAMVARKPSWRASIPLAVFTAASLLGARNVVVASIVLIPGLARSLTNLGTITGEERRSIFRPMLAALGLIGVVASATAATGDVYSFNGYPVAAVTWADRNGLLGPEARVVSRDFVGNYLEVRYGTRVKVFLDDRYDMFPAKVVEDFSDLNNGHGGWQAILDENHTTAVIWPSEQALSQLLAESPRWRILYSDQEFLIAVPR